MQCPLAMSNIEPNILFNIMVLATSPVREKDSSICQYDSMIFLYSITMRYLLPGSCSMITLSRIIVNKWLHFVVPILLVVILRLRLPSIICDDAFISGRIASAFSSGNGFAFNTHQYIYVMTCPAWVIIVGLTNLISGDSLISIKILSFMCEILLALSIVYIGLQYNPRNLEGTLASILLCLNPVYLFTSFGGMEVSLYLLTVIVSCIVYRIGKHSLALAVAAFSVWVRFDGFILYLVTLVFFICDHMKQSTFRLAKAITGIMPSLIFILAYIAFGLYFFDSVIPMSVLRKSFNSSWLSGEGQRLTGALMSFDCFVQAFVGTSEYWFEAETPYGFLIVPFMIGMLTVIHDRDRDKGISLLIVFTIAYVTAFVGSCSSDMRNYPWYFVPLLPGAYLVTSRGIVHICLAIEKHIGHMFTDIASYVMIFVITIIMVQGPLEKDVSRLLNSFIGNAQRERCYQVCAVYFNKYLESNATIAIGEIGAFGYTSRWDMQILDLYGLLRKREDLRLGALDLISRERPEAIVLRTNSCEIKAIGKSPILDDYRWHEFRTLRLGFRRDLDDHLKIHLNELDDIYLSISNPYPPQ